ncbi:sugar phosphate isomerase/epimerase family protein [Halomonas huangheensis]|uniref:Xylose isomerase-like TIM barrel domain-containing protein n=1 Tax=Halomonas huangheensis TaxID=1178482 RepID=W1N5P1_9GAMM|nr:sugar phosphate isomerase/epimerase family protein [Halomonas huangheensis]ALM51957.1 hypothetical protein AR456_06450 [Halomonas huangheensis]ERL50496.1 hypothetical protein BJB45_05050 [Halomonas huangheensis]
MSLVSVSTAAYDGYGFDVILASLARCGVRNVEIAFIEGYVEAFTDEDLSKRYAAELREEMQRHGQQCHYFSGHIDLGQQDAPQRLEARCRFAAELGAKHVITNAASLTVSEQFLAHAGELAAIAGHHGVRILLENPGNRDPNLLDRAAHIEPLLAQLDSDVFGINFDVGNLLSHCPDLDPLADGLQALSQADHFHIKPCRVVPDGYDFTPLGEGDIDDACLVRHLDARNVPFSLELPFRLHRDLDAQPWRDNSPLTLDHIERQLKQSLAWMSDILS